MKLIQNRFECKECDFKFSSESDMIKHNQYPKGMSDLYINQTEASKQYVFTIYMYL